MKDIHARAPINKLAAIVVCKGVHFIPHKKVNTNDSELPLVTTPITSAMRHNSSFEDLTGRRIGRFTVLGLSKDFGGTWVVRCDCGTYSTRKKKAILNTANEQDRCEHCRHLAYLQREEFFRRTAKHLDIKEL